jgi:proteasome lid subunit RPN8/RPN11
LIIKNKYGLKINIEDSLLNRIGKIGIDHYPNEFGGFLTGEYSTDFKTLIIKDCILPIKYKGFPYSFVRSVNGLKNIFNKVFKDKRQYYIGEWHTHPNGKTIYSQTDLNAMIKIEECETVFIKNPILLIIGVNENSVSGFTFYYYENKTLLPYEQN